MYKLIPTANAQSFNYLGEITLTLNGASHESVMVDYGDVRPVGLVIAVGEYQIPHSSFESGLCDLLCPDSVFEGPYAGEAFLTFNEAGWLVVRA